MSVYLVCTFPLGSRDIRLIGYSISVASGKWAFNTMGISLLFPSPIYLKKVQNDRDQICLPSLGHSLSFVPSFAPTVCLSIWRLGSFIKRPPRVSNYLLSLLKREALLATTDGRHGLPAGCSRHPRIWKCAREHGERLRRLKSFRARGK